MLRLIEQPPEFFRRLYPGVVFRGDESRRCVYLTFDDGPIPEVTPWVLDCLARYGVKATFFLVGDNVRRNSSLLRDIVRQGHSVGNHTMHHLQGIRTSKDSYLEDVAEASRLIGSRFFRPPHGLMKKSQREELLRDFIIVMHDVVTRDYSRHLNADDVFDNVRKLTRNGSIIVFHDSLKSRPRLYDALPRSIEWLLKEGYEFRLLDDDFKFPEY